LIQEVQPEIYDHRKFFKYDIALKEGESLEMLEKRVRKGLNELLLLSRKGKILLVTHGSVIVMIHKIISERDYYDFYPEVDINSNYKIFRF
jgi:broad specificity phosphatase PhoE